MTPARILLVEDDLSLGFVIRDTLEHVPLAVTHCTTGPQAWDAFRAAPFDLCLLDIMLPHAAAPPADGLALARLIRDANPQVPILFLSALADRENRLRGLRLGADDYLAKPFSIDELILKINVFLRRSVSTAPVAHPLSLRLDRPNRTLLLNGRPQMLTHRETDVLGYLLDRPNALVRRDELLRAVWGDDDYFMGRSLDVFITRLRKRFADFPGVRIENVHGAGFILRQ